MFARPPRRGMRTSSPIARAILRGAVTAAILALTVGLQSASASSLQPRHARLVGASAVHPFRCDRLRHATAYRRTRCEAARIAQSAFSQGSFYFLRNLSVSLTAGPAAGSVSSSAQASFSFRATVSGASFECSLDNRAYSSCSSPDAMSGLANGSHSFAVYAVSGWLRSRPATVSWRVSAVAPDTQAPSRPAGLVASAGDGQVALSWQASTDNVGVSGYWVLRNGTALTQVAATKFTDKSVVDGTSYSYTVQAYDAAGNLSAPSAPATAMPIPAVVPVLPPVGGGSPPTPPVGGGSPPPPVGGGSPPAPLTSWLPASDVPLSDAQAAADVTPVAENRPANVPENSDMPTSAQLQAFRAAINNNGQTVVQANPYDQYVTGHFSGTTDEIIQWAAWKWGIPADWLRAEYVLESRWNQSGLGDRATMTPSQYLQYPAAARIANSNDVYQSMGISQIKWNPNGSVGAGTEPLRWESTAFNADYQAATLRFYYDDPNGARSAWGDSTYAPGNAWASLGGWFSPYPWLNSGQLGYITTVQGDLAARVWAQPGF